MKGENIEFLVCLFFFRWGGKKWWSWSSNPCRPHLVVSLYPLRVFGKPSFSLVRDYFGIVTAPKSSKNGCCQATAFFTFFFTLLHSCIVMTNHETSGENSLFCKLGKCKELKPNFPSLKTFANHKHRCHGDSYNFRYTDIHGKERRSLKSVEMLIRIISMFLRRHGPSHYSEKSGRQLTLSFLQHSIW